MMKLQLQECHNALIPSMWKAGLLSTVRPLQSVDQNHIPSTADNPDGLSYIDNAATPTLNEQPQISAMSAGSHPSGKSNASDRTTTNSRTYAQNLSPFCNTSLASTRKCYTDMMPQTKPIHMFTWPPPLTPKTGDYAENSHEYHC